MKGVYLRRQKVIGVPAFEDGFSTAKKAELKQWYRSKLGSHVLITNGLFTRKTSGSQQDGLFNWLTHVNKNKTFDIDVEGPGQKFFVMPDGQLYAVLRPQTKMWGGTVYKVLTVEPEIEN